MPNIKSAKKRVLVIQKKTLQNQMAKSALKTYLKKFEAALAGGDKTAISASYKTAVKKLDQAASKGLLHKNTVARKKAGLTKKANTAGA